MAVSTTPVTSDLVLIMDNGVGASGQPLTVNRKFSKVKTTASNEDVFAVAASITAIQDKTLLAIRRMDTVEIEQI
jgi:hypothetical protein